VQSLRVLAPWRDQTPVWRATPVPVGIDTYPPLFHAPTVKIFNHNPPRRRIGAEARCANGMQAN
jgi:hypothetical protein